MTNTLNQINFNHILRIESEDIEGYGFSQYRENGGRHRVVGFCNACEVAGVNSETGTDGYRLANISHGAHTRDFLQSMSKPPCEEGWHAAPVMFVYESPSVDYGLYETMTQGEHTKRPTKEWYWVHRDRSPVVYPENFQGGGRGYGDFIASVILTFKLSNAYVTNLLKCALNTHDGDRFKGIDAYQKDCIRICFDTVLSREIDILQPSVIFAVGSKVEQHLRHLSGSPSIVHLPHPAGVRRGMRGDHLRTIYFWTIARALLDYGVVPKEEAQRYLDLYIDIAAP